MKYECRFDEPNPDIIRKLNSPEIPEHGPGEEKGKGRREGKKLKLVSEYLRMSYKISPRFYRIKVFSCSFNNLEIYL